MYVLYQHTQDDTTILGVSKTKKPLINKLKQLATVYARVISGYDEETFNEMYRDSIKEATTFWTDGDETYPLWFEIDEAEEL